MFNKHGCVLVPLFVCFALASDAGWRLAQTTLISETTFHKDQPYKRNWTSVYLCHEYSNVIPM